MNKKILRVLEQRLYRKIILCATIYLYSDPVTYYIQVKKKAFKINAKIEDVGLNEDKKSTETRMVTKFS